MKPSETKNHNLVPEFEITHDADRKQYIITCNESGAKILCVFLDDWAKKMVNWNFVEEMSIHDH